MRSSKGRVALGLLFLLSTQAYAQITCPLVNPALTDLRVAAAKLATTVSLSANCQSYQDNINSATAQLTTIANQISAIDPTNPLNLTATTTDTTTATPDAETLRRQQLATMAIQNLSTINNVFKSDKCGEEMAGFLDYADGFTDMVTGVSPFLALYGGAAAAPWVLGTTIGGAAAKMFIGFFKGKDVNMRKADQSAAFIKNSCTFYAFNQVKLSLEDLSQGQIPQIEVQLNAAKASLTALDAETPAEPNVELFRLQKASEKDKERVVTLQTRLAADPLEACSYIGRFARGEDVRTGKGLVERVWDLYVAAVPSGSSDTSWERDYFMTQLNSRLVDMPVDRATCVDLATRWANKLVLVSDAGQTAAKNTLKDMAEMRPYLAWAERKNTQTALVTALEAKLRFLHLVNGPGFNIEQSEIRAGHEQVQDTLFRSYKFLAVIRMRGLAEAWLKVKHDMANEGVREFRSRRDAVMRRLDKIQETIGAGVAMTPENIRAFATRYQGQHHKEHKDVHRSVAIDVCNDLRKAWSAWYDGLIHSQAGRDYCVAFDNVIDRRDYPEVHGLCFGREEGRLRTKSLRATVADVRSYTDQSNEILARMRTLQCRQAPEMTPELLKTKLE